MLSKYLLLGLEKNLKDLRIQILPLKRLHSSIRQTFREVTSPIRIRLRTFALNFGSNIDKNIISEMKLSIRRRATYGSPKLMKNEKKIRVK